MNWFCGRFKLEEENKPCGLAALRPAASALESKGSPPGLGGEKRKLIILDLNGLLVHRERAQSKAVHQLRRAGNPPTRKLGGFFAWERPSMRFFVEFCLENFDVAVWSSAMKVRYVFEAPPFHHRYHDNNNNDNAS